MARRKKRFSPILVVSVVAHVGVVFALAFIPQDKLREVVGIALNEAPKEEKKPEPPKPPPRAAEPAQPRAPRAPRAAAPQAAAASNGNPSSFQDLGLTLDSASSDGLAVNMAPAAAPKPVEAPPPAPPKPKVLAAKKAAPEQAGPPPKPTPRTIVKPTYTDAARRARVQGRVRLELSVNEQGEVTSAKVLEGLGYGLDEAAIAAAKNLRFTAAMQGGRPIASRFILAMRFVLGS